MVFYWLLSCFTLCSGKYLNYVNKNSNPPEKRNAFEMFYHETNNCLYLFGGGNGNHKFNDIWAFNMSNYIWERIEITTPDQPPPRTSSLFFQSQDDDSIFYMYGGKDLYAERSDLWEFNLKQSRWNNTKNFLKISGRYGSVVFHGFYKDKQAVFVIGGKNLVFQNFDVNIINLKTLEIETYDNSLYHNQHGIGYAYGDKIYKTWSHYEMEDDSLAIQEITSDYTNIHYIGTSLNDTKYIYYSITAVLYEHYFFIFGGMSRLGDVTPYIFRADMNNPGNYYEEIKLTNFYFRALSGIAKVKDKLWIFGGFNDIYNNELLVANVNIESKTIEATIRFREFQCPEERIYFTFLAVDHRIILFGGYSNGIYFNDLWIFYTKSVVWESVEMKGSLPSRRRSHSSGIQGDALLIWGGEDKTGLKSDFFIYNILKKSWRNINPGNNGPSPRKGACGVLRFPKFYIFGGKTDFSLSKEAWEYNFNTNLYTELISSPEAFHHAKCQLLNNQIYIIGAKNNENIGLNKILYFEIDHKLWGEIYVKEKDTYYAESVSMIFPDYFIEYGGVYKDIEANKKIRIFKNNGEIFGPWEERWSAFATDSVYVLSNLYYFSGGLESPSITITRERTSNKFNYISLYDITKDSELQLYCAPGSYKNKNDKCEYCPSSSYSESFNSKKCTFCPPGTASNNFALSSSKQCYPCKEGTFNSEPGQKECRICPSNQFCPIGSIYPTPWRPAYINTNIQPKAYHESSISGQIYDFFVILASVSLTAFFIFLLLIPKVSNNIYKLDLYTTLHETEINKSLELKKNKIGGAFTLMFIGIGIVIFGLNLINYTLRNVEESKSLQPLSVFENEVKDFKGDINVTVSFGYYLDTCGIDGVCQDEVEINVTNNISGQKDIKCSKNENTCDIVFSCKNCEIGTTSSVTFKLNQPYSFSTTISVAVSSESSIPESESSMSRIIVSPTDEIFVGSTVSKFYYSLTPSVFYSAFRQFPSKATGYHISEYSPPSYGSSFTIEDIITESGLIAVVSLEKSAFGFFTYRYQKQTAFLVAGAVIGSIAGVFQAVGFVMSAIEGFIISYINKSKKMENFEFMIQNRIKLQIRDRLDNKYSFASFDNVEAEDVHLKSQLSYYYEFSR